CPEADYTAFQDNSRHRFFNTNTLWLRVSDLRSALAENGGALPLPLIRNTKTVDPRDSSSPKPASRPATIL
ncbi:MAG: UTP--glucose-1-phosphate uridylyltransferase, partial [Chthoniobacterales bacterium]